MSRKGPRMTAPLSPRFPDVTAAILAGGKAIRMGGAAKALLEVGGEAILDRQIGVLRPRFAEIVVAAAGPDPGCVSRGLRVVSDVFPGSGPMAGLQAALLSCRTPWLFAVACDMPSLDGDLIDRLASLAGGSDAHALVPVRDGRPEPLHALYRAEVAPQAERCLREGLLAMSDLLAAVCTRYLGEADLPGLATSRGLANLNTPGDVQAARDAVGTSEEVASRAGRRRP